MPGRYTGGVPKIAGRPWSVPLSCSIQEFLRNIKDGVAILMGTPSTPTSIAPNNTAAAGSGPAPAMADHTHALAVGSPVGLGNANGDGTANTVPRADHVHKRDVRVAAAGSDVGTRNRVNFVDGVTIDFAVTDDAVGDEVDVTAEIAAAVLAGIPRWTKYSITHTQLQAAAMANDIELLSLPAGGIIHAVKIKHSTAFAGTGITDYNLSVGIVGHLTKYAVVFDVDSAVSNTNLMLAGVMNTENHGAATSIRLSATSTGANLDQSTAGAVDVWVLASAAV